MNNLSAIVIGDESLLVSCGEVLLSRGHRIRAVVSQDPDIVAWAKGQELTVLDRPDDLTASHQSDWLFSIANLQVVSKATLALGTKGAVNFHDGPLPAYAGLNAPVWALLNSETSHGVSWHLMEAGVDRGDLLAQQTLPIASGETAFSLNSKCYAAGLESFETVLSGIEHGTSTRVAQDFSQRSYFPRDRRPDGAGRLRFDITAQDCAAMVHALDFGNYWNPLTTPKFETANGIFSVARADAVDAIGSAPGSILDLTADAMTVACEPGAVRLSGVTCLDGQPVDLKTYVSVGDVLPTFDAPAQGKLRDVHQTLAPHEAFWRDVLGQAKPARLAPARRPNGPAAWNSLPVETGDHALEAALLWARISCGPDAGADLALSNAPIRLVANLAPGYIAGWVPVSLPNASTKASLIAQTKARLQRLTTQASYARDLVLRDPAISPEDPPHIAVSDGRNPVDGSVLTLTPETGQLHFNAARLEPRMAQLLADRLVHIADWLAQMPGDTLLADCPVVSPSERALIGKWNETNVTYDRSLTVPAAFDAQVLKTPNDIAIVFEHRKITYVDLSARVDAIAHALVAAGVAPGAHVGLFERRSIDMVAAALAIMKTGAAYVPLDPAYPPDRIAHYISDSQAPVIVTSRCLAPSLPSHSAVELLLDDIPATAEAFASQAQSDGIAYLIYTSGSTGLPKGVMVSHGNVINFFAGMDADVDTSVGMTWAAVTSLAFDISVLELFYTLGRGFKVVLLGDENRAAVSNGPIRVPSKKIDFNLFYWGNDDGVGRDKYALLLEGAKFADANGFNAVWTPERHFHAFGGPYPNPSVTGAAVAAVTRNLSVRAGSCVAPLHHTARIAEEWSVIDNLTNGRAGLAIASGWQPDDFVLRPENTPPDNKPAMFRAIEDLRKLWRGETVEFAKADGTPHAVLTQPRPVSPELPVWVTTAGNPATWREAGEIGANVLTHLLGQSVDEVEEKIAIYHDALRKAGHDPDDFTVTLMLHTYLAKDRETARRIAREPMKNYLRSAAGLIKQYAWAFPAFKRPQGVNSAFEMDLGSLGEEEIEAILDFAFERYFEESGLFGTIEDALARVEQVRRIGVTEVACLIDYGIPAPQVLEGLQPLAQVLKAANAPVELPDGDLSLAAQLIRHNVSHLQCTPSMAQIIAMNDEARLALSGVKQLFFGGEALPASLVQDLRRATRARITNMYGPTETTIWSSTHPVPADCAGTVPIGRPIANTGLHILDAQLADVPIGVPGELCIGGEGVTPGYWQRPEMNADRFIDHPKGRLYRTGDLVCLRADGIPEFLGRNDHQVKIRGQRVELGEIETILDQVSLVTQSVVIDRKSARDDTVLAAYFTADGDVEDAVLRDHLAAHLPEIMIPASFTRIVSFPLTPNRKIDRKALPEPTSLAPVAKPASVSVSQPTQAGTEAQIAAVWSRILGVGQIGREDNFFGLGGHSLLAVQAHRELKAVLNRSDLSITDVFRFPTLGGLADHLDGPAVAELTAPVQSQPQRSDLISKRKAMRATRRARVG